MKIVCLLCEYRIQFYIHRGPDTFFKEGTEGEFTHTCYIIEHIDLHTF